MLARQSGNGKRIVSAQLAIFQAEHVEESRIIQVKRHVELVTIDSTILLNQHITVCVNKKNLHRVAQSL